MTNLVKFKLIATIPVVQYGNIQPEIEVEAETYEQAVTIAEERLLALWNKYVEPGKQLGTQRQMLHAWIGGDIYFDPVTHTYTNEAGEKYLSGSEYAQQFQEPFDAISISEAMAKKAMPFAIAPEDIRAMWELKANISRNLGTALHEAMELYGKHKMTAEALSKQTHIHDHPILKKAVEDFYAAYPAKYSHEVLIVDHINKRAGRIDLVRDNGDDTFTLGDFKTNGNVMKSIASYWKQLEFYKGILEANKLFVTDLIIYHWNGEWTEYVQTKENILV